LPHQQKARQAKQVESRLIATADKREQAREMKNSGISIAGIARILQVSRPTIYSWIAP
jgi:DNA invertase Pin-like site-specific DNA recombinase